MKTTSCFIRFHTLTAIALAALSLVSGVASAATVNATWNSAVYVPVTASGYTATGNSVSFTLNFAPATGTELMVVKNTAVPFISGTFDNLTNGQAVVLSYGGTTYNFVANYYGGTGNDLVLVWANNRPLGWGANEAGQLGDNSLTQRPLPVPVTATGVLAGKTVVSLAVGGYHSLALCSDGTVAGWGDNSHGELGTNTPISTVVPVAVSTVEGVSALYGKKVVAIAAGWAHSLALCSDGTVAAWGYNDLGALGNNTTNSSAVPVAVDVTPGVSALAGKTVVAVSAGTYHSLALCSDGTVAAWGHNGNGQIGDASGTTRLAPVAVNTDVGSSALAGKTVVALAAGGYHSLALCSDGTVAGWGMHSLGQLGDNATTGPLVPVAVNTAPGVSALNGKTVVGIAAGCYHSLALCSDGTVASWGYNNAGQLGNTTTSNSLAPVAVNTSSGLSALSGRTVVGIAAGTIHSLALCSDGTVAAWGDNASAELGDHTTTQRRAPVALNTTPLTVGERFTRVVAGSQGSYSLGLAAAPVTSTLAPNYSASADIPLTANGLTATGATVNFTLNFAPATGTELMVIRNTSLDFINGAFDNLTNGQAVALGYGGTIYTFVANYYGGSGNDLVLVWANQRLMAWGHNSWGQIGDNNAGVNPLVPVPVTATGILAGKTVVAVAAGDYHSLALCSDGTLAAWGRNINGQLGNNSTASASVPVVVNTASGVSALYGKRVVGVAAGQGYSMALCSDGTVAAWGGNAIGQLGDGTSTERHVPVAVNTASGSSALYGKTVVSIAAGAWHNLAVCSDGTVATWGGNSYGQLGDNSTTTRSIPVAVVADATSALYGKTVVAIAAGTSHSLALCSDGTVAGWGRGADGQLGDNTMSERHVPVAASTNAAVSALAGRQVVKIAAGAVHSLALCADGMVAAFGRGNEGQLGDGTASWLYAPTAVNTNAGSSALFGKLPVAVVGGQNHSVALDSDGTLAAWGDNTYGQVGDNTLVQRNAPAAVNTSMLAAGEAFTRIGSGAYAYHTLALVAVPPFPRMNLAGNGLSIANGDVTPSLTDGTDFGTILVQGGAVVRTFTIQNTGTAPLNLTGAPKVVVTGAQAAEFAVTAQPASPVAAGGSTTFQVTFSPSAGGVRSATLSITNNEVANTPYMVAIRGTGSTTLAATYNTAGDVPLIAGALTATGSTVNFTLNCGLATGTELTVVRNTGLPFISGTFNNLTNGQTVVLSYGGTNYTFVANYYGGSGNDLVLVWASNRIFAWGFGLYGELGDNIYHNNAAGPAPVVATGVLAGKTAIGLAAGFGHSLALCSDGTVASWGDDNYGALGDNSIAFGSFVPVAVSRASDSALYGKRVVAIAAGAIHGLALCSDGTVAAWGDNRYAAIGDGTTLQRNVPVAVSTAAGFSALYGKTVVAIAAGGLHSLALCSDGTVAAWGYNASGQLGDNTTNTTAVPVAVNTAQGVSALSGKTVVAIAAGYQHSLALCSDGTAVGWGDNSWGELGDNTWTLEHHVPVAVNTASGVSALWGKTVVGLAAGTFHTLFLCSDGTLAACGDNNDGELGDGTTAARRVPVLVNTNSGVSALFGKSAVAVAAGRYHSVALCSDGTTAAWGLNDYGQLGNNTTNGALVATAVNLAGLAGGGRLTRTASGPGAFHNLAIAAGPPAPAMNLSGNSLSITNGDLTPTNADGTDFGGVVLSGGTVARTFTVVNAGTAPLNLTGTPKVAVSGPQAADFTVTAQPGSPLPAGGGTTTFQVTFTPGASGLRSATLSITNDDAARTPYVFAIQGTGSLPLPAPIRLTSPRQAAVGVVQFSFTNYAGLSFTVLVSTNVALPLSQWKPLAAATEVSPGVFQFSDPQAANYKQRFYRVRSGLTIGTAPLVLNAARPVNGAFGFVFTNTPGAVFTVLATTNAALPLTSWTVLGGATELSPGQFQFTDPQATNSPRRFYRVRSP
jgi:alpha-tubulin suppressor-like RCC1 family protein